MERQWFAVRTQPRREFLAKYHFERQGFRVYLPVHKAIISHARKREDAIRPFFPGYLFLHLAPDERQWTTISGTIGAACAVRFGEFHPPVPNVIIETLRSREDECGFIVTNSLRQSIFQPGDRVLFPVNQVQDLYGIFEARRGEERAIILVEILKRQVSVEVPLAALVAA